MNEEGKAAADIRTIWHSEVNVMKLRQDFVVLAKWMVDNLTRIFLLDSEWEGNVAVEIF